MLRAWILKRWWICRELEVPEHMSVMSGYFSRTANFAL